MELIGYLGGEGLDASRRAHAEAMLADLLEPVEMATIEVRVPQEERAREVAQALGDNPSDKRTLDAWGREVGASGRTLARSFLADTGMPFGRWRTLLRLQAALPSLAAGEAVGRVAATRRLRQHECVCRCLPSRDRHDTAAFVQGPARSLKASVGDEESAGPRG